MNNFTRAVTMAIPATAVLLASAAGVASAYWTNSDAGTGTATTGANVPVTFNQTTRVPAMYPGQAAVTLAGTFNNANPGPTYDSSDRHGLHHRRRPRDRRLHRGAG